GLVMRALSVVCFFASFLVVTPTAGAQRASATVRMSASATRVDVGDILTLEVRADAEGAQITNVELPDLPEFEVVARHVAQPMQFQFGARPVIRATVIHQLSLRALRPGTYVLDPARASVDGERFTSNGLTIEVTGTGAIDRTTQKPPIADVAPPPLDPGASAVDGAVFDPDVFLRTVVDKSSPHVGEQVTVTVYLYTTVGGQPQLSREPSTDGLWVRDLLGPVRTSHPERQVVHGIPFRVYVLRRFAAFPLRSGNIEIGAPELRLEQISMFGLRRGSEVLERRGVPITLDVQALPDPVPAGAVVGAYTMEAAVDRTTASVGDAITLTVKVRGTGNLNDVRVALPPLAGVRVLEPEVADSITSDSDLVGGERRLRFLLLPEVPGPLTIPRIRLPYFDPATRRYGAAETAPIDVTITGTAAQSTVPSADTTRRAESSENDGRHALRLGPVHPRTELRRARPPVSAAPWYRWALAAPPLLWILVLIGGTMLSRARKKRVGRPTDGHIRSARKRVRAAEALEKSGDARAFYTEISGALAQALESQLDGPATGLTHAELRRSLEARGMPDDLGARIIEELESCDFARFSAAGASTDEMERCRQRVEALFDRLQSLRPMSPKAVRP
ncbi:MAG: protein BatD, partial [Polyangiaceae bacterium]|nr:protein BatD [Polyangiaceae bacterium]